MKRWYLVCALFFLLYVLFPTQNSTLDAWAYAGDVRHGIDLFHPHHLLFSAASRLFYPDDPLAVDVLARQKIIQACLASFCLWILGRILQGFEQDEKRIAAWLLLVGSSFGVMRFATENEVYLWPILWSLLGTWAFIHYVQTDRQTYIWLSSLVMALACLFHQIHCIWWLAIFLAFFLHRRQAFFPYVLPAFLIPLTYLAVLGGYLGQDISSETILRFILRDFYQGTAEASPGLQAFLLTPINLFRTFVQIHGIVFKLLTEHWLYVLPAVGAASLGLWGLRLLPQIRKQPAPPHLAIRRGLLGISLGHLALATWAAGNAEFMVMLPFVFVLYLATKWIFPTSMIYRLGFCLLIWNFTFGLFPLWQYDYYHDAAMVDFVQTHPDAHYILTERNIINNQLYYRTGKDWNDQFISAYKAPQPVVDSLLQMEWIVYSNTLDQPQLFSRAMLAGEIHTKTDRFDCFQPTSVDTIKAFVGKYHIWQLSVPCSSSSPPKKE
ncbi:MAG: hypothetical protein AAFP89_27005 [Bacteroidota bacterium]